MYYADFDAMIQAAIDSEWIDEAQAPRLRHVIVTKGWADSLVETGLTVDGVDLYAICADYL